ncbi:MAG: ABC transporter substrate-binding protein [Alphaproteobacteria bacterium]|nr:MAG: ABC transporter substrate-binding protein [Alphaproteobacteria bacterium]TMK08999.1 MAG: ABC transporter substrate-binding protein [Alphaproteobacteria bacterium]TMK30586.1 MAG: ABC transporter substrate-binding protein [Alphaproteobacteria bacterium]
MTICGAQPCVMREASPSSAGTSRTRQCGCAGFGVRNQHRGRGFRVTLRASPTTRANPVTILRRTILAASALPLLRAGALAQSSKTYRVGLVSIGPPESGILSPGMIQNFAKRGYVEGRNIEFERRAAQGKPERLPGFIDELVAKPVDVIVTSSYPAAAAAKERGGKIPIVVINSGDPVATGLAASLAHPGSNITGVSEIATELSAKRLALLKEAVPSVRAVAVLWNADDFGMTLRYQAAEVEAKRAGMLIVPLGVHAPDDFDTAFSEMTKQPPDAILMVTDILTILNRKRVIDFAREHRLPAIYEYARLVRDGGLMSYGPDEAGIADRAAGLADRILKGANPADLPLELPSRFQLAVNLQTAKTLDLTIPEAILVRADDVVE